MRIDLTGNQEQVMKVVPIPRTVSLTAQEIVNRLGYPWTYAPAHKILTRLERRGIVMRRGRPARWNRTPLAHKAFEERMRAAH